MIVTNLFVLQASYAQLYALATKYLEMTEKQVSKAQKKGNLAQVIGTKLSNSPTLAAAFADGTLDLELPVDEREMPPQPEQPAADEPAREEAPPAGKRDATMSAKAWLHALFSMVDAEGKPIRYTLAQLVAMTGKTEVNIRTMLSDLRSARYCGKYGILATKSTRVANVVYYSL